jgi:hypothetical protein
VLPEGAKQLKPSDLMPEICVHWKELSEEQRVSKTQKSMVEIEQLLKMKELAGHHMMQNTFSDAQKTLEKIDHKVRNMSHCNHHTRTVQSSSLHCIPTQALSSS